MTQKWLVCIGGWRIVGDFEAKPMPLGTLMFLSYASFCCIALVGAWLTKG